MLMVTLIRRSPDPVIQYVDALVLDRVRRQAQVSARERMIRELEAKDPALAALFAVGLLQPDAGTRIGAFAQIEHAVAVQVAEHELRDVHVARRCPIHRADQRGNQAVLSLVPALALDQTVELTLSLSGFTASFDKTSVIAQ